MVKVENDNELNNQFRDLKNMDVKSKNLNFNNVILVNNLPLNIFWL